MSDADDDDTLRALYRQRRTAELIEIRAAMALDWEDAWRRPGEARRTQAFCERRRRLIADVLRERGVEALT